MGQTLMGGTSRGEDVNLLSPQQQQYLSQAGQGFGQFGQQQSPEMMQDVFQKSYIDPAMQAYQQQIIPGLQEQLGESSASGALNRALASGASDIATGLGQQYGQFYENQQNRQLQGLQGLQGLSSQRTFEPTFNTQQGILGPLIGAGGAIGAGYASRGSSLLPQILKLLQSQQGT